MGVPPQVEGITLEVMRQALEQARAGRRHILQQMQACDPPPAKHISQYAPRIRRFTIDPEKIGQVIGSGGRNIKMLQAAAGCDEITVRSLLRKFLSVYLSVCPTDCYPACKPLLADEVTERPYISPVALLGTVFVCLSLPACLLACLSVCLSQDTSSEHYR